MNILTCAYEITNGIKNIDNAIATAELDLAGLTADYRLAVDEGAHGLAATIKGQQQGMQAYLSGLKRARQEFSQ
jgi:copper chaperone CopZ